MVDWKQEVMIIFSWHDSWIGQEPLANMCSQTLLGITPKDEVITNMGNLIDKSWHWKLLWGLYTVKSVYVMLCASKILSHTHNASPILLLLDFSHIMQENAQSRDEHLITTLTQPNMYCLCACVLSCFPLLSSPTQH